GAEAVLRKPGAEGSSDSGVIDCELYLRERAVGAALRDAEYLRQPFPSRHDERRATARIAWPWEHSDCYVVCEPHVRGVAREVGPREPARVSAAAATAQCAAAQGERRCQQAVGAPGAHG